MICDIDDIASYAMPHDSSNILGGGSLSTSVVERVRLVGQEAKSNARQYFEVVRKGVDPALHAWVIVEGITVETAELRSVPL